MTTEAKKRGCPTGAKRVGERVKVSLSLDAALVAELSAEAKADDRSLAGYITIIIKNRKGRE